MILYYSNKLKNIIPKRVKVFKLLNEMNVNIE